MELSYSVKKKPLQLNKSKTHSNKLSETTPENDKWNGRKRLGLNRVLLYQLDPDIRRLVRKLERLHLTILKRETIRGI